MSPPGAVRLILVLRPASVPGSSDFSVDSRREVQIFLGALSGISPRSNEASLWVPHVLFIQAFHLATILHAAQFRCAPLAPYAYHPASLPRPLFVGRQREQCSEAELRRSSLRPEGANRLIVPTVPRGKADTPFRGDRACPAHDLFRVARKTSKPSSSIPSVAMFSQQNGMGLNSSAVSFAPGAPTNA